MCDTSDKRERERVRCWYITQGGSLMRFGGVPHTLAADDDGDALKKRAWSTGKCTFGTRNRIFSSQLVILKYTPDQTINMCVTRRKKPCPWLVWSPWQSCYWHTESAQLFSCFRSGQQSAKVFWPRPQQNVLRASTGGLLIIVMVYLPNILYAQIIFLPPSCQQFSHILEIMWSFHFVCTI